MNRFVSRTKIADCLFLLGAVALSALPYLGRLGFYSDDWDTLAAFSRLSGQGLRAMFRYLAPDPAMRVRPVEAVSLVLGFRAFGDSAMYYHVFYAALFALLTICLYLALRELLRNQRWLAFAIALVFALLPHYSTDRFCVFSQQADLCMMFALFGIYALLRSMQPDQRLLNRWTLLAGLAFVLSLLSYEVALGLIGASVALAACQIYRSARARSSPGRMAGKLVGIAVLAAALLLVGMIKSRMQARLAYHHHLFAHFGALTGHTLAQAVRFNLWTYGIHMPMVLIRLYHLGAISPAAAAVAMVIGCLTTAYLWRQMESSDPPSRRGCLWMIVAGFVVFALGYGLFFPGIDVNFSTAGLANRVTIASAPGAALVLVAIAGLACSVVKSAPARVRAFGVAIGLICAANCLATDGIAWFWADAAAQQATILRSVAANVRSLPAGSVLLLDGFCRYSGPGVVFETDWDATGAIQLALGDWSLSADVVSANMHFGDGGVTTTMYGRAEEQYPYGGNLFVYSVRSRSITPLPSREAAALYLSAMNPAGDSGCPAAREGDGARIF